MSAILVWLLELHGEFHLKASICHRSIGLMKEDLNDYNGALESLQRALDIRLQLHGEKHEVTAMSFNDVGRVQRKIGTTHQRSNDINAG